MTLPHYAPVSVCWFPAFCQFYHNALSLIRLLCLHSCPLLPCSLSLRHVLSLSDPPVPSPQRLIFISRYLSLYLSLSLPRSLSLHLSLYTHTLAHFVLVKPPQVEGAAQVSAEQQAKASLEKALKAEEGMAPSQGKPFEVRLAA